MSFWRWFRCLFGREACPAPDPGHDPRVHALKNSATKMRMEAETIRRRKATGNPFGDAFGDRIRETD